MLLISQLFTDLFHEFIRDCLSVNDHVLRLKNLEGKVIDVGEGVCGELNTKFQRLFTLGDSQLPGLPNWCDIWKTLTGTVGK